MIIALATPRVITNIEEGLLVQVIHLDEATGAAR